MSALNIALISPKTAATSFTSIKKAVAHITDNNYKFCFLPRIDDVYEPGYIGQIFRKQLFCKKYDLTAVFFDPDNFELSLRILLHVMEYSSRTIVLSEISKKTAFDFEGFLQTLGVDGIYVFNTSCSIINTLDFLRSYAVSLFYTSPAYINYGPEAEYAMSLIEENAGIAFGKDKKTWAASRLLYGGAFVKELFYNFELSGYDRENIHENMFVASRYLKNCEPSINFKRNAETVFESITQTLKESCLITPKEESYRLFSMRTFYILIYIIASICALTLLCVIFFD